MNTTAIYLTVVGRIRVRGCLPGIATLEVRPTH